MFVLFFQNKRGINTSLILITLLLGTFLAFTIIVFVSTLLVDIAHTFEVTIGTFSQLSIIYQLIALGLGLAMGALAIRFRHKSLYVFGTAMYAIGALLFYFAPNFTTVLFAYFFLGIGGSTISIMVMSLIGALFPLEKRGWAVGLYVSVVMLSYVVVAPLSGMFAQAMGWRSVLLWFIIPMSVISMILGLLVIPSKPDEGQPPSKSEYSNAFKRIFLNKSAVACIVGNALRWFMQVLPLYAVSFYRIVFLVPPSTGGIFLSITGIGGIIGGTVGGRLINKLGRKPIAVTAVLISGVCCILFTYIPDLAVSVAIWTLAATTTGLVGAGLQSLALEQVPGYRGSMMSINESARAVGQILGITIGGLVLNLYANNFYLLMPILGSGGLASGVILLLFATDPCKTQLPPPST